MFSVYVALAIPSSIAALPRVVAALRAEKKDLVAIIHGPSENEPDDDRQDDEDQDEPPSLPKP